MNSLVESEASRDKLVVVVRVQILVVVVRVAFPKRAQVKLAHGGPSQKQLEILRVDYVLEEGDQNAPSLLVENLV